MKYYIKVIVILLHSFKLHNFYTLWSQKARSLGNFVEFFFIFKDNINIQLRSVLPVGENFKNDYIILMSKRYESKLFWKC